MSKLLAAALLIAIAPGAPALATVPGGTTDLICPGLSRTRFQTDVAQGVRRFAFDKTMLEPFLDLWRAGRRPLFPVQPESVTVYAFPRQPYLIGYERGGCVIAFLAVERAMLWRWLAPKLGWPA